MSTSSHSNNLEKITQIKAQYCAKSPEHHWALTKFKDVVICAVATAASLTAAPAAVAVIAHCRVACLYPLAVQHQTGVGLALREKID